MRFDRARVLLCLQTPQVTQRFRFAMHEPVVLGILLAVIAKAVILSLAPDSLPVTDAPDWWPIAAAIALGGALLGAIYPGLKAARQDAIEALSYE